MKQPYYPGEWAIKITLSKQTPVERPLHGNRDLLTREAQEYYSYRNSTKGTNNETTRGNLPDR